MLRLLIKINLALVMLLTAGMVIIHAQPADHADLDALLMPQDCSAPCFLGIHPGTTTSSEAIDLLQSDDRVGAIVPYYIAPGTNMQHLVGLVYWDWKADAPVWFRAAPDILLGHSGAFNTLDGVVQDISVATNIPFGSIRLALGKPSAYRLTFRDVLIIKGVLTATNLRYRDAYVQNDILTEAASVCDAIWNLWFKPGLITFTSAQPPPNPILPVAVPRPFLAEVRGLQSSICYGRR